jgi:hypothetical protein
MPSSGPLDTLPLWGLFLVILCLILLSVEGGYRLGQYRRRRSEEEKEAPVGAMVGATLGLLAFMLAFTFGLAAARFETRRQVLLDEANAIGTTYLRAGMLPERRDAIRTLLRDYVDTRLEAVRSGNVTAGIRRSEHLQEQLWAQAEAMGETHPTSIVVGLRNRIPGAIWVALCAVAVLSLAAMGYHAGLSRTSRSLAELAVAFTFAVVIGLIADLDRPQEGVLQVSQQALLDLRQSIQVPRP